MKHSKAFFLLLLLLATVGCGKDNEDNDDKEEIYLDKSYESFIGRWQQFDCGGPKYMPDSIFKKYVEPDGHTIDFFEDRTARCYSVQYLNCRTDADYLYYILNNGQSYTFRYAFTGSDTLRLDYIDGLFRASGLAIMYNVYKRLE
ncbi:MAG: hypothetical protein LBJ39_06220 [Tannerellaceae bacterium]|jgi:hypothetical protein|nr:hypothetical protein [Tannerellaceae bacterium]